MASDPGDGPYRYRPDVLAVVWRHGILPTSHTPPELARGYVRELYKYEIRRLRERYLKREFSKRDYAGHVDALRRQYGVLALVPQQWLVSGHSGHDGHEGHDGHDGHDAEADADRDGEPRA